jgi:hypothetical protein
MVSMILSGMASAGFAASLLVKSCPDRELDTTRRTRIPENRQNLFIINIELYIM